MPSLLNVDVATVNELSFAADGGVAQLCSGSEHTMCKTQNGTIYVWGYVSCVLVAI